MGSNRGAATFKRAWGHTEKLTREVEGKEILTRGHCTNKSVCIDWSHGGKQMAHWRKDSLNRFVFCFALFFQKAVFKVEHSVIHEKVQRGLGQGGLVAPKLLPCLGNRSKGSFARTQRESQPSWEELWALVRDTVNSWLLCWEGARGIKETNTLISGTLLTLSQVCSISMRSQSSGEYGPHRSAFWGRELAENGVCPNG